MVNMAGSINSTEINHESRKLKLDQYKGHNIGLVTSGGDSQGMNAAVRAVVRYGLYGGCKIYYIREGYTGLIEGGDHIVEATWYSVSSMIHRGGTFIGTARSKEFMTDEGQQKATKNLVQKGISNLIVIGGDGSLTGADKLKKQWSGTLEKLIASGEITKEQAEACSHLRVVGLIGTIDNDFPQTDMTIGADSALHRIEEAVYAIASTASSHKRTFIVEVMGRHCGFLALKTALTAEADFLFMPEYPPPDNWPDILYGRLHESNELGKRLHLIILSEGATDMKNNPIRSEDVRKVLLERFKIDARITVLGHVQRGGNPSAYDRVLASRSGAEAVRAILELTETDEPIIIAIQLNVIKRIPLSSCLEQLQSIRNALAEGDYEKVIHLRGRGFEDTINIYHIFSKLDPLSKEKRKLDTKRNFAILLMGSPAGGMNACIYALVRMIIYNGGKVLGIHGSFAGLTHGKFVELHWSDVYGLMFEGGAYLGTRRFLPPDHWYDLAAKNLDKFDIDALIVVGGFLAFTAAYEFTKRREKHAEFCIPIVVIPATSSNDVPGTDSSIGADTSLNAVVQLNDLFRQSAMGTTGRVFVVETHGGKCGYISSVSALASGADASYIYEEDFTVEDLIDDINALYTKMTNSPVTRGLILKNESSHNSYDTDFITKLCAEKGKDVFTARKSVLGHIQQGFLPTSFDRSLAVKMAVKSSNYIIDLLAKFGHEKVCTTSAESAVVIGLTSEKGYAFSTIESLIPETDFENRYWKKKWWLRLRPLTKMLGQHHMVYRNGANNSTAE